MTKSIPVGGIASHSRAPFSIPNHLIKLNETAQLVVAPLRVPGILLSRASAETVHDCKLVESTGSSKQKSLPKL